jgi:hypothetical protein
MNTATVALWALLLIGLAATLYFLATNRPANPGLVTVATHGMPVAVALTYIRSIVLLVLRGSPRWEGAGDVAASLITLAVVDFVVVAKVLVWRQYRSAFEAAAHRQTDQDHRGTEQDRRGTRQDERGDAQDRRGEDLDQGITGTQTPRL